MKTQEITISLSQKLSLVSLEIEKIVFGRNEKGQYNIPTKKIGTIYGVLNEAVFCLAVNAGALIQNPNSYGLKRKFCPENIGDMFMEGWEIVSPVQYIREYLKRFWPNISFYSCDAVRSVRNFLCQMGLFKLEDRSSWKYNPKDRERRPNPLTDPEMVYLLLWAFHCEARLLADDYGINVYKLIESTNTEGDVTPKLVRDNDKSLPAHCAYTVVKIFNEAFKGICPEWRRVGEVDNTGRFFFEEEVEKSLESDINPEVAAAIERAYAKLEKDNPPGNNNLIPVPPKPVATEKEVTREVWEAAKAVEVEEEAEPAIAVKVKSKPKLSAKAIIIPKFAWEMSAAATEWWQEIRKTAGWLFDHAPDWLLDDMIPF